MNDEKKFLQVVRNAKEEMVIVDGNYLGLLSLYEHIESLLDVKKEYLKDGKTVDVDLMIPEWGGEGLNHGKNVGEDWNFVAHLKISRLED